MNTLTIIIPDNINIENQELLMMLASQLYKKGKISLGQAAGMAGLTKRTFAELLSKYQVSLFNYPVGDLLNDIKNA